MTEVFARFLSPRRQRPRMGIAVVLGCLASCISCSSNEVGEVRGQVTVDGAPVDAGTIQFKPSATPGARGAGAAIKAGEFALAPDAALTPGSYSVVIQASEDTGKILKDPQRGDVHIMQSLAVIDSPKEVEVTSENAASLQLSFVTK
jgi:hypothetical protein